jgi:hypothetical protein
MSSTLNNENALDCNRKELKIGDTVVIVNSTINWLYDNWFDKKCQVTSLTSGKSGSLIEIEYKGEKERLYSFRLKKVKSVEPAGHPLTKIFK